MTEKEIFALDGPSPELKWMALNTLKAMYEEVCPIFHDDAAYITPAIRILRDPDPKDTPITEESLALIVQETQKHRRVLLACNTAGIELLKEIFGIKVASVLLLPMNNVNDPIEQDISFYNGLIELDKNSHNFAHQVRGQFLELMAYPLYRIDNIHKLARSLGIRNP